MLRDSRKIVLALSAAAMLSSAANAGVVLDFKAGVGMWDAAPSGSFNYGANGTNIDLEDTLGLENSTNMYAFADFNHFVPIIPNIRVELQELKMDATKHLGSINFGGLPYNDDTKTSLDLSQNDLILYWGIPGLNLLTAGILDVSFGLDLKQFKGGITLDAPGSEITADMDFVVPMGYIAATIDPPFIPASISASHKEISYKDSSLKDSMIKASINLPIPLPLIDIKAEVGYKKQSLVMDKDLTDSLEADIGFEGVFVGIAAKF